MPREDHQPWEEPPARPALTPGERQEEASAVVALVLALGDADPDGIAHAVQSARAAGVGGVLAIVDADCPAEPGEVEVGSVPGAGRGTAACAGGDGQRDGQKPCRRAAVGETPPGARDGTDFHFPVTPQPVESGIARPDYVLEYDARAGVEATRQAGNFELFGLPYGLLAFARDKVWALFPDYDAVLVMDAAQHKITDDHLSELIHDARQHPDADALASWIMWLRRAPYLIKRHFLEELDRSDLVTCASQGAKPVPRVRARDHVFGEEQLAAPARTPRQASAFLDGCTMTALQAIALARRTDGRAAGELLSPNQVPSLMGPSDPIPLSAQDRRLLEAARRVIGWESDLARAEREELAWADAFGTRNRRDFPLLNDRAHKGRLAYLDSAATSQRLGEALQAQRDYDVHENANVYRGAYRLSAQSTFTFNDARKRLEDFIGAQRRQTVYTMNATAAINLVAQAWGERNIAAGDVIACSLADHHSNLLPFAMLAERKGARIVHLPYDAHGRIDRQAFREALAMQPKLVCLAHIGNVFGIAEPVRDMAREVHAAGGRVLVDAAQSFPHMRIDVNELGADWVAFSAHKAYGPLGIGALWVSPDAFAEMDPLGGGGGTVSHVSTESYYLRPKALQYEPGTPPVSQAVGWAAAIDYLDALGMEHVARHGAALTRHAVRGLARIDGVTVIGDHAQPDGQTGLVSFTVRSVSPSALAGFLGALDVAIRAGGHCALPLHASLGLIGTGRISIGVYNTRDDIDAALAAIALAREVHEQA